MKYYVRTTKERSFTYDLDYELLVDENHKPVDSFIEALYHISEDDSVLLEDDLMLCKNFKDEIEKVIQQHPDDIIQFFTKPTQFFTTHYSDSFAYNQCTYYPKGKAKLIADKMVELRKEKDQYDTLESRALSKLGWAHLIYRPCLVQHKDIKSLIQKFSSTNFHRSTLYFKDYLDLLGIQLLDACKDDNKLKLKVLLDNDIKKWEYEINNLKSE